MVTSKHFPCRRPAHVYQSSNAFISSACTVLRESNFVFSLCDSRPPPVGRCKPRINRQPAILSALNSPRRKSKFNSKKQQKIKHADAEVVSNSESDEWTANGSDDEDNDENEDFSQYVQFVELGENGDYEDDDDDDDDDEGTIIAISDEGGDDFRDGLGNRRVSFIRQDGDDVIYLDGNNLEDPQFIQTNLSDLSIADEDDFDDDENEEEHDSDVRAYDDNGMTVIDIQAPPKRKEERPRTRSLLDAITRQPEPDTTFAADADSQPPIELDESTKYVRTVVRAADTRKAEDIRVIRVSKLTYITTFIIIASGNSAPQIRAIANLIEEDLSKVHKLEPRRIDGVPNSGWILLDCTFSQISNYLSPFKCQPF